MWSYLQAWGAGMTTGSALSSVQKIGVYSASCHIQGPVYPRAEGDMRPNARKVYGRAVR